MKTSTFSVTLSLYDNLNRIGSKLGKIFKYTVVVKPACVITPTISLMLKSESNVCTYW